MGKLVNEWASCILYIFNVNLLATIEAAEPNRAGLRLFCSMFILEWELQLRYFLISSVCFNTEIHMHAHTHNIIIQYKSANTEFMADGVLIRWNPRNTIHQKLMQVVLCVCVFLSP